MHDFMRIISKKTGIDWLNQSVKHTSQEIDRRYEQRYTKNYEFYYQITPENIKK